MATSGPGAIHLLNGLYDAKLDHVPVVAIVGQTNRAPWVAATSRRSTCSACSRTWPATTSQMVTVPEQLPNVLDRAIRIAIGRRAPTAVIIPADVQELDYSAPHARVQDGAVQPGHRLAGVVPTTRRSSALPRCSTPAARWPSWSGRAPAARARSSPQVADLLGAGVAKALLGKDVLSDELPWVTGSIGLLGTRPSYEMMRDCDTLLTVGSSFPYTQFMPEFGQARAVQIDIDPTLIGMRYPYEVNLVGDAADRAAGVDPAAAPQGRTASWRDGVEQTSRAGGRPWTRGEGGAPTRSIRCGSFAELSPRLPDNAIVTADSGSSANWYARQLRFRGDMRGSLSGNLATMGPAVPYGIGAKFAHPDRPAIVFDRRRRDADERPGRAHHHQALLAASGRIRDWWWPYCTTTTSTR